jgi:PAS domain S-box-containing protein
MKTQFLRGPFLVLVAIMGALAATLVSLFDLPVLDIAGPPLFGALTAMFILAIYAAERRRRELERALSSERGRARQNALLGQIVGELRSSFDETSILEAAVEGLGRVIDASRVVVYRLGAGGTYRLRAQFAAPGADPLDGSATLPSVLVEDTALAERLGSGDIASTLDPDLGALAQRLGVRALVTVPIGRNDPTDLVLATHYLGSGRPGEEETRFVQRFGAQLAGVLHQAELQRIEARAVEVRSGLLRVASALGSARESRTVLELTTSVGAPLIGARASAVFSAEDDGRDWKLAMDQGISGRLPERSLETLTDCLERVLRDRVPIQVDESALVGRSTSPSWHAVLVVPLFYGREILGVFLLERAEPLPWRSEELEDARVLAELSASALKSAELFEALASSEARYAELYDSAPNLYQIVDRGGVIEDCNLTQSVTLGTSKSDLKGKTFENWLCHESLTAWRRLLGDVFERGPIRNASLELRTRLGERIPVLVDASAIVDRDGPPSSARMVLRDVSEVKRLQDQLRQSQKLEVIGALAGGVAHDFNNLLGGILGYASLLRNNLREAPTALRYVETIERSAVRGAELISRLLAVSRRRPASREPVELNSLVEETLELLSHTFHKKVRFETRLDPRLRPLMADASQLQQIVLNLCVNARDAMPEGGMLRVSTRLDEREDRVVLSVSDSGVGMEPAILERLFEPFFSTKGEAGTGLGLSVVYGIVKSLGGDVRVQSVPGRGATFDISLPCQWCEETASDRRRHEVLHGHGELILIVDDEEVLRDLGKDILESHGYRVTAVANGSLAIDFLREAREPVALVILDVVMPGLGGSETYRRLRSLDSRVPVLLSSGLSGEDSIQEILAEERTGFIPKPYGISELTQAVASVLSKGGRPVIVH